MSMAGTDVLNMLICLIPCSKLTCVLKTSALPMICLSKILIFHGYVSLPEGMCIQFDDFDGNRPTKGKKKHNLRFKDMEISNGTAGSCFCQAALHSRT